MLLQPEYVFTACKNPSEDIFVSLKAWSPQHSACVETLVGLLAAAALAAVLLVSIACDSADLVSHVVQLLYSAVVV